MTFSDLFQGHDYSTSNNSKIVLHRAILAMADQQNMIIERRHFQWLWTTPTPGFKVTPFFDAEYLRNGTRYWHSCFYGILL